MSETPIYDRLIGERDGRLPGRLTDRDLRDLIEHLAGYHLPPLVNLEAAVVPVPAMQAAPVASGEPEPVAEATMEIEVKALQHLQKPAQSAPDTEEPMAVVTDQTGESESSRTQRIPTDQLTELLKN